MRAAFAAGAQQRKHRALRVPKASVRSGEGNACFVAEPRQLQAAVSRQNAEYAPAGIWRLKHYQTSFSKHAQKVFKPFTTWPCYFWAVLL